MRIAAVAHIGPGERWSGQVGRFEVAMFNVDGEYFALENICPHQGGPMVDGWIEDRTVTCPWHAWCFDLRTGRMTLGDFATIPRFEVRVEDGSVFVSAEPLEQA